MPEAIDSYEKGFSPITLGGVVFDNKGPVAIGAVSLGYVGDHLETPTFVEFLYPLGAKENRIIGPAFLKYYLRKKYGEENCGFENDVFYGKEGFEEGVSTTITEEEYRKVLWHATSTPVEQQIIET